MSVTGRPPYTPALQLKESSPVSDQTGPRPWSDTVRVGPTDGRNGPLGSTTTVHLRRSRHPYLQGLEGPSSPSGRPGTG